VGKKMVTQQYLKIPKVKKTEEFKELVKATKGYWACTISSDRDLTFSI
jgi:hypothetical protein